MNDKIRIMLLGIVFGLLLSLIGFSDWAQINAMFRFADLRLVLTFAVAVGVGAVGFTLLEARKAGPRKPFHRGTIPGAVLFGAGWALTGACPSIVLVQLGEGQLAALITLVGIVIGSQIYTRVNQKVLHVPVDSCA